MKIFAFIIGLLIPVVALYLGFQVSSTLGTILLAPIIFLSSFFNETFVNLPYYIHALLVFLSGIFFLTIFLFFSRIFYKKING